MVDWEIGGSSRSCGNCGKPLAEGEEFLSALYDHDETFERRDFCLECWPGPAGEMFSYWRTAVPVSDAPVKMRVNRNDTWALFESLTQDDHRHLAIRYVVALVLLRQKQLVLLESEKDEEGECMVLRRRGEEAAFRVRVLDLSEDEILAAQEHLCKVVRLEP